MAQDEYRKDAVLRRAEEEIDNIEYKWRVIKTENFNPVTIALQMLDSSSLGKRHEDFQQYHKRLNNTLEGIAEEYYGGFNNSILTFSGLYDRISTASISVNTTKKNLIKAKDMLSEQKSDLDQLYMKSKQLTEIVTLLNRIEEINKLSEEIALNVEKKQFLTAVSQLIQAIQFLFDPELRPIEALSGLRQRMEREKEGITQVMIEELHNHLYLKSPYCQKGLEADDDDKGIFSNESGPKRVRSKRDKKKERRGSVSGMNIETRWEGEENPESDSFAYLELIMESLLVLDKAEDAIDAINNRVKWELSRVVDSTITEVEDRGKLSEIALIRTVSDAKLKSKMQEKIILQDFVRTLFNQFENIIDYHEYLVEIVKNLNKRERYSSNAKKTNEYKPKKVKLYNLDSLWHAMEQEILMVLTYHLIPTEKDQSDVIEQTKAVNFKQSLTKKLFVMRENETTKNQTDDLYKDVLNRFDTLMGGRMSTTNLPGIEDAVAVDHYANSGAAQRHRILVSPDIELASLLFTSTIQFVSKVGMPTQQQISEVLPNGEVNTRTNPVSPNGFLQRFYLQVFMPEAESQITNMFYNAISASDAFQPLYALNKETERPIFRGASALAPLISSYEILHSSLSLGVVYDKWSVLINIAEKYYERSLTKFHDVVSSSEGKKSSGAEWAKNQVLVSLLTKKIEHVAQSEGINITIMDDLQAQVKKEIEIVDKLKHERSLFYNELIFDPKKLVFLAQLCQSLNYVYKKISIASRVDQKSESTPTFGKGYQSQKKIQSILSYYRTLANECLILLRVEIITHIIYYLDLATRESSYCLSSVEDESATLPDQYILALNADLTSLYEKMLVYLLGYELSFLFDGVSYIMSNYLVVNSKYIRAFDIVGCHKMYKNIVCLQQNLTNISLTLEDGLDKAKLYYSLFENEIKRGELGYILKHIAENGVLFSYEEYKRMFDFSYKAASIEKGAGNAKDDVARATEYKSCISKLQSLMGKQTPISLP
ncbi:hypothetical protein BB559_004588 [Furculomyces boomerangus]|uniref:Exocyst complex component Sec8 n=1 Tax=Furculomyces boomerangus TaxID=61424 RepID=A0A2T9YDW1_9FUNG|nr:hypothetical protein BB559_006973 [Furculomyces boomerangus]PVU90521.1 hypothetical protein BB559_004588 [Furculomyces boomerangus]